MPLFRRIVIEGQVSTLRGDPKRRKVKENTFKSFSVVKCFDMSVARIRSIMIFRKFFMSASFQLLPNLNLNLTHRWDCSVRIK